MIGLAFDGAVKLLNCLLLLGQGARGDLLMLLIGAFQLLRKLVLAKEVRIVSQQFLVATLQGSELLLARRAAFASVVGHQLDYL